MNTNRATTTGQATVAFLIKADDPSLADEHEYGLTINRELLRAVLAVDKPRSCQFQTYWGSLMLPSFRFSSSTSAREGETALVGDYFLLWSSACDLCQSVTDRWSTLNPYVPWVLGTANVYVAVISRLPEELRQPVDRLLRKYPWYIGALDVDMELPLHRRVFDLLPGWRYSRGSVDQPEEEGFPVREIFEGVEPDGYELTTDARAANSFEIPWSGARRKDGGQATLSSFASSAGETYQEAIVSRIADQFIQGERVVAYAATRRLPLVEELYGKLHDYALNLDHEEGGSKATFFRRNLAIERKDWRLLAIQLISSLQFGTPEKFRDDPRWGERQQLRFQIEADIVGLNGRKKKVVAGWKIEDDEPAKLVTITPGNKAPDLDGAQNFPVGDWAALYSIALDVANRAMHGCRPDPIAIEGPKGVEVIPEGLAGFAWVSIPDARFAFARWLLASNHATRAYPGVFIMAPSRYLEPASAWVEALAAVFQAAGQQCSTTSEID